MEEYEKLGAFYLGRPYNLAAKEAREGLLLYDSRDLVTHAVCVGMTGSGKTGLCISLIEEAAIDNVPAILIDPKGDLCNLLLTFPELRGPDFAPWVDPAAARQKDLSIEAYADQQAELWKNGLASWGEGGDRIQRLRDAADFRIYTPGSSAGRNCRRSFSTSNKLCAYVPGSQSRLPTTCSSQQRSRSTHIRRFVHQTSG